jgi:hypothetical protein
MKSACLLFMIIFLIPAISTSQAELVTSQVGKRVAEKEFNATIMREKVNNVVNSKFSLIKNSKVAVQVAEPLLFSVYGEKTIVEQKPYDVHYINNHWVVLGKNAREAEGSGGGYFLIILHDSDSRVIRMDYLRR